MFYVDDVSALIAKQYKYKNYILFELTKLSIDLIWFYVRKKSSNILTIFHPQHLVSIRINVQKFKDATSEKHCHV